MIDFSRAHEIIQAQQKRGLSKKKLANNTYLSQDEKSFKIELHDTAIIRILSDESYEIDTRDASGKSWQTATTKARINEFAPVQIQQKRGAWYLQDGSLYFDGIRVSKDGRVLNADSAPVDFLGKKKILDKMINKFTRAWAKDAIENGLQNPSSGDCLYCQIFSQQVNHVNLQRFDARGNLSSVNSENDDMAHIWSHLEEGYFVPSMLLWAIKEQGYSDPGLVYALVRMGCERGNDAQLKRHLRKFFSRRRDTLLNFVQA